MSARVEALFRHPVKSLGEEAVGALALEAGRPVPWDRVWAVAHGRSEFDPDRPEWVRARNFVTQTHIPGLARIRVAFDEAAGRLTLAHPERPEIALDPDTREGAAALAEWIAPLAPMRPGPYRIARLPEGALTDFPDSHVAINSVASLRALEGAAGRPLARVRFRGNVWIEGLAPWEEFDLVGREIALGEARLRVTERIMRCNATAASPETGRRDLPLPEILESRWGHGDFGVYAQVVRSGRVAIGDPVAA